MSWLLPIKRPTRAAYHRAYHKRKYAKRRAYLTAKMREYRRRA